jgi:hypothetical protein
MTARFVDMMGVGRAAGAGDLKRDDLVLELSGLGRGNGALVAVVGIFAQFILQQAVFPISICHDSPVFGSYGMLGDLSNRTLQFFKISIDDVLMRKIYDLMNTRGFS